MNRELTTEDILSVAKSINVELSDEDIQLIKSTHETAQEDDPSATWDLVVENQIRDVSYGREPKSMSRFEAAQALKLGKKLTHKYFSPEEWVMGVGDGYYLMEDGVRCSSSEFWKYRQQEFFNDGWELYFPA